MEHSAVSGRAAPALTIDPARGGVLAAGGIMLAVGITMTDTRLDVAWSNGVHLIVALLGFALVFGIAMLSPLAERPLAYQAVLSLSGLALLVLVLDRLARVLSVHSPFTTTGTLMWMSAVFTLVAALAALRFQSLACALVAGLGASAFVLTFVDKVFNPSGVNTFRWVLFLLALGFAAAAVVLRTSPWQGYSVPAVDVAGFMLIALGSTFVVAQLIGRINPFAAGLPSAHPGFGWKAILVLGSLALFVYAALTRERGPGFIGLVSMLIAILIVAPTSATPSIVGWPLILLLGAAAAFGLGLAPRESSSGAAPPPPPAGEPPPPPTV
jgi:hypothetical protein